MRITSIATVEVVNPNNEDECIIVNKSDVGRRRLVPWDKRHLSADEVYGPEGETDLQRRARVTAEQAAKSIDAAHVAAKQAKKAAQNAEEAAKAADAAARAAYGEAEEKTALEDEAAELGISVDKLQELKHVAAEKEASEKQRIADEAAETKRLPHEAVAEEQRIADEAAAAEAQRIADEAAAELAAANKTGDETVDGGNTGPVED